MKTKYKIFIAKILYKILLLLNFSLTKKVKRNNIFWKLDLSEGIDLSIFLFGKFESEIIKAVKNIKTSENFDIIDIGANVGVQTLQFAKEFVNSKIYAIEPTGYAYEKLRINVSLNAELSKRIDCAQAFITNKINKPDKVYSSWKINSNKNKHPKHFGIQESTANANIISLDSFFLNKKIKKKLIIKCDVDGHELEVLKSGINLLTNKKPAIVMELAPYLYKENGYELEDLINFIISLDYNFYECPNLNKINDIYFFSKSIPQGSSKNIVIK